MNAPHLDNLNDAQRQAVTTTGGPLLVIAGAGAGKTRVIGYRILHLIHEGIEPKNILAITFTNKAAGEMKERVTMYAGDHNVSLPTTPTVSTFHALGVRILREFGENVGVPRSFVILDRKDSLRAVKDAMKEAGVRDSYKPETLLGIISRFKGDAVHPENISPSSPMEETLVHVARGYKRRLRESSGLDFDDLLLSTVDLLRNHNDVRDTLRHRYSHVHVDEYQDTNSVQYELMKLLVSDTNDVCVVGDADQTIYTWRGAQIKNILSFEKDFQDTITVYLEENYRSTKTILAAANDVIKKNTNRFDKTLFTNNDDGELLETFLEESEQEEAVRITTIIREEKEKGTPLEEIAVLYRANFQSRAIEQALMSESIPYHMIGTRFFERKEVKDVLSYLRLLLNPQSTIDLQRVINEPKRGIGKKTQEHYLTHGKEGLSSRARAAVSDFENMMKRLRDLLDRAPAQDVVQAVLKESGLEKLYSDGGEDDSERLQNMQEVVNLALSYEEAYEGAREALTHLLEDAALSSDQDELAEEKRGVRLMTVHAAKGLEFDVVIIPGLEQGLFPLEREGTTREEREEERRLFYVALTRARKRAYLLSAWMRTRYGSRQWSERSEFLADIDPQYFKEGLEDPSNSAEQEGRAPTNYLEIEW